MSRTPIPDHLIHRPDEIDRNAKRFDQLCRLAEEIALPVVRKALVRESAATGTEALTSDAKLALQGLVDEATLEGLDDPGLLDEFRKSLEGAIPPPDEKECRALARDVAQVLMGAWVETLRRDLSKAPQWLLSPQLLPSAFFKAGSTEPIRRPATESMQPLKNALESLAITEGDAAKTMNALRTRLFSQPRLLQLPFDLVVAGAPRKPLMAMTRSTSDALLTARAQSRAASLTVRLAPKHYAQLTQWAGKASAYYHNMAGQK